MGSASSMPQRSWRRAGRTVGDSVTRRRCLQRARAAKSGPRRFDWERPSRSLPAWRPPPPDRLYTGLDHRFPAVTLARCRCGIRHQHRPSRSREGDLPGAIQWVQSYVTDDRIYCVYIAPNADLVREHARLGGFPRTRCPKCGRSSLRPRRSDGASNGGCKGAMPGGERLTHHRAARHADAVAPAWRRTGVVSGNRCRASRSAS